MKRKKVKKVLKAIRDICRNHYSCSRNRCPFWENSCMLRLYPPEEWEKQDINDMADYILEEML